MSVQDALNMLDAGATLIQLYTGFIYEGPGLVRKINKAILKQNKEGLIFLNFLLQAELPVQSFSQVQAAKV